MFKRVQFVWVLLSVFCSISYAQITDSATVHQVEEVTVKEFLHTQKTRSAMPVQVFDETTINSLNALQVSDVAKHFSGVIVKDYGGVGGMKTVSVRGFGAAHTGVSYDGIVLGDAQTGQVDIGRFSLDNVSAISLTNGQSNDMLQTARSYASSGLLDIRHQKPIFQENKNYSVNLHLKTGSFGYINPSALINNRWSKTVSSSISGEYLTTDGDYPFVLNNEKNNETHNRKNSDVESFRIEPAFFFNFNESSELSVRTYYFQSERGLPGSVILYNPNSSQQRLWDKNFFSQAQYKHQFTNKLSFLANGKFNWSYQNYIDNVSYNPQAYSYYQWEYYASGTLLYRLFPSVSISFANDGFVNKMNATLDNFAYPTRYSWLSAFAAKYVNERFTISANALATIVHNEVKQGESGKNDQRITPAVSVSYKPFLTEEFRIRAFYKEIFRLPTFNDLYYDQLGKKDIQPEYTKQYNIGITWHKEFDKNDSYINFSIDGYYNKVKDKIIAVPKKDLFFPTIENKGLVNIKGVDITTDICFTPHKSTKITVLGNYTYQNILDKTDSGSKTYNNKLPYTPNHTGACSFIAHFPAIQTTASYNAVFSSNRYYTNQNDNTNMLTGYADQSISLQKTCNLKNTQLSVLAELLNFMDKQYYIVNGYPMQGRSFRVSLSIKL